MRFIFHQGLIVLLLCGLAAAQGTPPSAPNRQPHQEASAIGTPPQVPQPRLQQMKNLIKTQVKRALDGNPYPLLRDWHPLTEREKFGYFVRSTYAGRTFADAGINVLAGRIEGERNAEYETGVRGLAQRYGVELATNETDIFFQKFLFPALLKQDPRYFRNPELPFKRRALYSMSRVFVTRTDSGRDTFNSSRLLAAVSSRALSSLYVPGQEQGLRPLAASVSFNLLRDAGLNLLHEFWPDVRRKLFHR